MRYLPTRIYRQPIPRLAEKLAASIERGCSRRPGSAPIELFFRADDIGVPSHLFREMVSLFQRHGLPLCLAVVPAWLTARRHGELRDATGYDDTLWCWHQHGRLHRNFEPSGKKQEFGPARDLASQREQLRRGRDRLQALLGTAFSPFFTPPWNRCTLETAQALQELQFKAISRSSGARPDLSAILPDIQVNVDLHTRKEADAETSLDKLLLELEESLAGGRCGIMLHHQRLNGHGLHLLDLLLGQLARRTEIVPCRFNDMV